MTQEAFFKHTQKFGAKDISNDEKFFARERSQGLNSTRGTVSDQMNSGK